LCEIYKKDIRPLLDLDIIGKMINRLKSLNNEKKSENLKSLIVWSEEVIKF